MSTEKIVYLFGAGASRNSVPIVNNFSKEMINLGAYYYEIRSSLGLTNYKLTDRLIGFIEQKGTESLNYGTIDNWAHILHRNGKNKDLEELKFGLSLFLTLWQQLNTKISKDTYSLKVDSRYLKLLPQITDTKESFKWSLKPGVKVATWNYDNQFEMALCMLHNDMPSIKDLKHNVKFSYDNINNPESNFDLLHLNGYCGFYSKAGAVNDSIAEIPFFHQDYEREFELFEKATSIFQKFEDGDLNIRNHIHYGFESRDFVNGFNKLKNEFAEATYVVVIGYTFPNFNREYDKALFSELGLRNQAHIIIQDPRPEIPMRKVKSYLFNKDQNCSISQYSNVEGFLLPDDVYSRFWI